MDNSKQELVIKISNQTIEVRLEDGTADSLYMFCHYINDNTFDNMKDMDDFVKFLAKILQIVPKEIGDRITKFAFDAIAEALQKKLQKELLEMHTDSNALKNVSLKMGGTKKTEKEEKIFRLIAEEDLKERISQVMGDMEYHELLNKMDKSN